MLSGDNEGTDNALPNCDEAPHVASDIVQDSVLLKLPLEVLQTITWYMDVGTFFASLFTCKQFLKAAKCRPNVIRHLYSLPGLRLGLEDTSTPDLFLRFRKRAAESGCAAGVLADITRYRQTSRISLSNAAFSPANPSQLGSQAHLATVHDGGIIQVYDLGQHVRLKAELHIRPEDGDDRRMEVVRVSFAPKSRDIAILYHHVPCVDKSGVRMELQDRGSPCARVYKLVTFHHLSARTKGFFYNSHQQETRDIKAMDDEIPIGLALAANGNACIAWKNQLLQYTTNLTLIGRDDKLMEACNYDCNPRTLKIEDPANLPAYRYKERQIFSIQFVDDDKKLNLYRPGQAIHSWYTNTCSPMQEECGPIFTNFAFLNIGTESSIESREFRVGMPFHGIHFEGITDTYWHPVPHCRTSYLALGISRDVNESSNHPNAFVVQADCDTEAAHCNHRVRLDYGRRLTSWKAVALLAGWRQSISSLGTILAISPDGTKVAAADWSRLLIWSLDPKLLHQGELQHYFPIRDYNEGKGFGRLRPTLLLSEDVVYNMMWINETCLYATTERGLVRWDLGPKSGGQRDDLELRYDAWPDTALATPAVPPGPRKRILPW